MPFLLLTITFIIALVFGRLLDKSAGCSLESHCAVYGQKSKLGMIVGSTGLVTCILLILFLAAIQ